MKTPTARRDTFISQDARPDVISPLLAPERRTPDFSGCKEGSKDGKDQEKVEPVEPHALEPLRLY